VRWINPLALFHRAGRGSWRAFWATTFEFDVEVFDEHVLRVLGERCQATILADAAWMAGYFEGDPHDGSSDGHGGSALWRHVNRDYLLRCPHPGRLFHPKTYLMAAEDEGLLLVGSGNLTLSGIARGHELFTPFSSDEPVGRQAILAWCAWVEHLVSASGDDLLASRLRDLKSIGAPWLLGTAGSTVFEHNRDAPLAEAFVASLPGPVDELCLAAPFLDPGARAIGQLIERVEPKRVALHLSPSTSVVGSQLRRVLEQARCDVRVFEVVGASGLVHAKVIGAIGPWGARALVGSANLSIAALWSAYDATSAANVEAGVLISLQPDDLRALLVPPALSTRPMSLSELEELELRDDEDQPPARPLRLDAAVLDGDEVYVVPMPPEQYESGEIMLSTPVGLLRVVAGVATGARPLSSHGALVWLTDTDGTPLSGRVPVTDPAALAQRAGARRGEEERSIRELQESDLQQSELGRLIAWLDAHYIFDIDSTAIPEHVAAALEVRDEESTAATDAAIEWDVLQEAALLDPRAARYAHGGHWFADPLAGVGFDPELDELAAIVSRVPGLSALVPARLPAPDDSEGGGSRSGRPWSLERRREMRFANAIERFARAHADPRNAVIHPEAPAINFACLIELIWALWVLDHAGRPEIGLARRISLFSTLLLAFDSYIGRLSGPERSAAAAAVAPPARSLTAALVYLALRDGARWEDVLFDWQQPIRRLAFELDVIAADDVASTALADIGVPATAAAIANRLEWAALFDDESYWASRLAGRLGLARILVRPMHQRVAVPVDLMVDGLQGPLTDPRAVRLISDTCARDQRAYTVSDPERTVARVMPKNGQLEISVRLRADDPRMTVLGVLTREQLAAAADEGVSLRDLFPAGAAHVD